jgi:hypothetical protein
MIPVGIKLLSGVVAGAVLLRKRDVVSIAKAEVGAREVPAGSNGGPRVNVFTGGRREPWCAHFVAWCFRRAGRALPRDVVPSPSVANPLASVAYMELTAKNLGYWLPPGSTVQAGDVIFYGDRGVDDELAGRHVGLVVGVSGRGISTVEGNVSNQVDFRLISPTSPRITGFGRFP